MNKERWQQVEEIFNVVVDLPPVERESYLKKSCGEDAALRKDVEKLLKADEQAENFIESPVPMSHITRFFETTVMEAQSEIMSGRIIGQYKLLREIGRGGMGAVFLAERADKEFYQRVAIKLIKRGMDTDFILKRFRNERQILANLNHPNIARLLDGGTTDDGLPYFVMEYIEGKPVTRYCDAKRLTLDERLKLFRQVCAAIVNAHQNLVIHRDIKPGNILVTDGGVLKLLDFGIAKILNPELAHDTIEPTATAVRLMTPEYASPEQVRGEKITPASDQYSLGVLLYELITGHRPYRLKNYLPHEVARVICEEDPDRPSTAISRIEEIVGADKRPEFLTPELVCRNRNTTPETLRSAISKGLDDIVMQALNKDLNKRYESVEEFSADILRYLKGEPVRAARYTPTTDSNETYKPVEVKEQNSIAILPLKVLRLSSIDDTDGSNFLGVGLADALITRLSNIKSLTVRPTASVMKFSGDGADALAAGKELRVNFVLDGRMVQAGERVRVTVQLINIKTQAPQWAAQFDENLTDILSLQDVLSEQVAHEIIKNLSGAELAQLTKRGTDNAEAYEKYLRGRFHWHSYTEDGLAKAIRYFYEAIALDPNFAAAYSGVADYHTWLGMISVLQPTECFLAAKEAATKALELDDKLAEAHASLALVTWAYDWDLEKSGRHFKRAIQLNKNYTQAHEWYTYYLASQGRFDEAVREMKYALDIDPQSPQLHLMMGSVLHSARRFEEGARYIERAAELEPDNYLTLQAFGWLYPPLGKAREALAPCRKALNLSTNSPITILSLAHILIKLGETEEPKELLKRMHALEEHRFVSACNFAVFYAELGDNDKAFEYLNKMIDQREYWSQWLRVGPRFDPMRDDPRFAKVLERVKPLEKDTGAVRSSKTQIINTADEVTDDAVKVDTVEQVVPLAELKKEEKETRVPFYRRFSFPEWIVVTLSAVAFVLIVLHIYSQFRPSAPTGKAQRLTNNPATDMYPRVSPDGNKILFISARDGNSEVYIMNIDGSDVKRLTYNSTFEGFATWFPDGNKILVETASPISSSKNDFWIMNADGSNQTKIPRNEMHSSRPSVSPDGKQIAFASADDGKGPYDFNIWVMNVDGSNIRKLTDYYEFDSDPAWSPDGKQIAFIRATERGAFDIMIMNADGSNQKNITNTREVQETLPAWTPDGKQFAFARSLYDTRNNMEIWVMNVDGSNKRQITNSPEADTDPTWLPDNKRLVFQSKRDGNEEIYLVNTDDSEASGAANNSQQKSIAILPFKTDGNDETEKALSVGLPDALGAKLSEVKQLSVKRVIIINNVVLQEQKGPADIEYVVSGDLKRVGNNLQINARMTHLPDDKVLWAETFDQPFTNIATLQSAIADRILQALTIQLTDREAEQFKKRYTNNNEAYQLYLAGRYHLGKRTHEGIKNAISNFEQAAKLDANFALAYAGLADCYAIWNLYPPSPPDGFTRAKEYATKALALDDALAEAHTTLGFVKFYSERDWDGAEKEFRRAIELNSNYPTAHHWFALMLSAQGRHDEALGEIKQAEDIDAGSLTMKLAHGNMLIYAQRYDEAIQQYQNAILRDEGSLHAYMGLRRAYQLKGQYDEANATLQKERAFTSADEFQSLLSQAETEASTGRKTEASATLKKMLSLPNSAQRQHASMFTIVVIYSLLDDKDKAFKLLEQASKERRTELTMLKVHPQLDNLRSDTRFQELLRIEKLAQ